MLRKQKGFFDDNGGVALLLFIVFLSLPLALLTSIWLLFEQYAQDTHSKALLRKAIVAFHAPSTLPLSQRKSQLFNQLAVDGSVVVQPLWVEDRLFLGACFAQAEGLCADGFSSLGEIIPKKRAYVPILVLMDPREHLGAQQIVNFQDVRGFLQDFSSALKEWSSALSLDALLGDNTVIALADLIGDWKKDRLIRPPEETLETLLSQALALRTQGGIPYGHVVILRYGVEEFPATVCEDRAIVERGVKIDFLPLSHASFPFVDLEAITQGQCAFVGVTKPEEDFDPQAVLADLLLRKATNVRIIHD